MNTRLVLLLTLTVIYTIDHHPTKASNETVVYPKESFNLLSPSPNDPESECSMSSMNSNCPLWGECNNSRCVCRDELSKYLSIKCEPETLQLSVVRCYCVTFDNETRELINGQCIETVTMVMRRVSIFHCHWTLTN